MSSQEPSPGSGKHFNTDAPPFQPQSQIAPQSQQGPRGRQTAPFVRHYTPAGLSGGGGVPPVMSANPTGTIPQQQPRLGTQQQQQQKNYLYPPFSTYNTGGQHNVPPSESPNLAFALVNGMQLIQCVCPLPSEGECAVEAEAQPNIYTMNDYGKFEVSTLLYTSVDIANEVRLAIRASLSIDGEFFDLGPLPDPSSSALVSRYVDHYPQVLEFKLVHDSRLPAAQSNMSGLTMPLHPDEEFLMDELVGVLKDETTFAPGASAPHTNVHNRLKDLEVYNRVVTGHYNGKWTVFLANHTNRVVMKKLPGAELHLVLTENEEGHTVRDQESLMEKAEAEVKICQVLEKILKERDYEYKDLLVRMGEENVFTDLLSASQVMTKRFIQNHPEVFWLRNDTEHTTRIGLRREDLPRPGEEEEPSTTTSGAVVHEEDDRDE